MSAPDANGWHPIETMPAGKWVYVFVPGTGPGFCAIKKPNYGFWGGRIIGLESGKHITQAKSWRPCFKPPEQWPATHPEVNLYDGGATGTFDLEAVGFMCLTDFENELGHSSCGAGVYPTLADLKKRRLCVGGCGAVEVAVTSIRVVSSDEIEAA